MPSEIRKVWRALRPIVKDGFTFAEIKDLVASAALPVEELSHLQQKSLPARGASKSDLLDAVDDLISADDDPETAIERLIHAILENKESLHDKVSEVAARYGWEFETPKPASQENTDQRSLRGAETIGITATMEPQQPESLLDIFISHSSADADLAEALIELTRAALDVPHSRIRCTSVDGYRLPGGVSTDDQLQREVRDTRCLIALLTPRSLHSPYVLFELGARWGARLRLIPVLAKGITAGALRMPLSALNALSCQSRSQIHQLLADIGGAIGRNLNSPAEYERYVDRLQECSELGAAAVPDQQQGETRTVSADPPPQPGLSSEAEELLSLIEEESDAENRGIVEILKEIEPGQTMFFPRLQYAESPLAMKSRLFRHAVSELVSSGRLHPPEDNPSRNTRTYEYR